MSVQARALPETIYQGKFNSLGEGDAVKSVSDRIIEGLSNRELIAENGRLAGEFVRHRFNNPLTCKRWIALLDGQKINAGLPKSGDSFKGLVRDFIRWSRTWKFITYYKNIKHQVMSAYRRAKEQS